MTHAELVVRAVRWLRNRHRCPVVFAEMVTRLPVTMDAVGFTRGGMSHAVECKVSRSDFRADRHKIAHRLPYLMPGDFRWYFTPPGLLTPADLPDGWGLAECGPARVKVVCEPSPVTRDAKNLRTDMTILLSACQRHQLGVGWRADEARFDPYGKGG